jgi:hypothetical protein
VAVLGAGALAALCAAPAAADPRCARLGSASYQATRVSSAGSAQVYVSGRSMRIEGSGPGGSQLVTLLTPSLNAIFSPTANPPVALRLASPRRPNIARGSIRTRQERSGGQTTLILEATNENGEWREVQRTVCRNDGVLLEVRDAAAPGQSNMSEYRNTNIRVGPQNPALFRLPPGFRVVSPPPPPRR